MLRGNDDDDTPRGRHHDSATRLQEFRLLHRNRPLKQLRSVVFVLGFMVLYGFLLLSGSEYSYESVSKYNLQKEAHYLQDLEQQRAKASKRRKARLEANRNKARQKAQLREQSRRNQTISENTTTLLNGTYGNMTDSNFATTKRNEALLNFINFASSLFVFVAVVSAVRIVLRACILARLNNGSRTSRRPTTFAERSRTARQQRFRNWVRTLNQQRQEQGERPLSMSSLRLVLRERDFNGNDYDALLNFGDESGPAFQAMLATMGATRDEIQRLPHRTLMEGDDLLTVNPHTHIMPTCAVCLEPYSRQQQVRTIPCFHTFHTQCIDPWLSQKAVCPVCKHPALA